MKFSWFFNGTLEAHDLAAVYLTVLIVQGGYAAWVAWQWARTRRNPGSPELDSVSRNRR